MLISETCATRSKSSYSLESVSDEGAEDARRLIRAVTNDENSNRHVSVIH